MKQHSLQIFLICSVMALFYGCACNSGSQQTEDVYLQLTDITMQVQIPEPVIEKGNEIIIKRTGVSFFNNYINLNIEKCREIPDGYFLSYNFQMPGKGYINEAITFILDKKGALKPGFEITGIPDCSNDACRFDITKEKAMEIAQQAGLAKGIKDWDASFEWDSSAGRYVWLIRSTLSESMGSNGKKRNRRKNAC